MPLPFSDSRYRKLPPDPHPAPPSPLLEELRKVEGSYRLERRALLGGIGAIGAGLALLGVSLLWPGPAEEQPARAQVAAPATPPAAAESPESPDASTAEETTLTPEAAVTVATVSPASTVLPSVDEPEEPRVEATMAGIEREEEEREAEEPEDARLIAAAEAVTDSPEPLPAVPRSAEPVFEAEPLEPDLPGLAVVPEPVPKPEEPAPMDAPILPGPAGPGETTEITVAAPPVAAMPEPPPPEPAEIVAVEPEEIESPAPADAPAEPVSTLPELPADLDFLRRLEGTTGWSYAAHRQRFANTGMVFTFTVADPPDTIVVPMIAYDHWRQLIRELGQQHFLDPRERQLAESFAAYQQFAVALPRLQAEGFYVAPDVHFRRSPGTTISATGP